MENIPLILLILIPIVYSNDGLLNYNENWNNESIRSTNPYMKFKRERHDLLDFYTGFPSDIELEDDNESEAIDYAHLNNAYRISMEVKLKFDFPFYGHKLQKLTIGVGGFIYVGDQTHSWLAATQFFYKTLISFLNKSL
ncbi:unnamed protein product [Meloidogyne enterolobii]|uniref:Uncharacterized protein n=1 Tax=Meloidogyne enterolobii TaxID=390850 RepID=A0ACB0YHD1_MELEN